MHINKKVVVPEHEEEVYQSTICDICGVTIFTLNNDANLNYYYSLYFNHDKTESEPEKEFNFDVCSTCSFDVATLLNSIAKNPRGWEPDK